MNKRQEVVLWIAGLIVAAISAYQGYNDGDWLYEYVAPVVIVAGLLIHRLRTPGQAPTPSSGSRRATTALVLVLWALAFHHARSADIAVNELGDTVHDIADRLDDVEGEIENLKDQ